MEENKRNHKRFTKEEDDIIANHISVNDIMDKAFEDAAIQLNRTKASIVNRYYTSKAFESYRKDRIKLEKIRQDKVKKALIKEIKNSPNNIQEACRRTAAKTGMSTNSLVTGYYSDKHSYLHRSKMDVCFTLISGKKVIHNGKNSECNQPRVSQHKTNRLFEFFKNLFK